MQKHLSDADDNHTTRRWKQKPNIIVMHVVCGNHTNISVIGVHNAKIVGNCMYEIMKKQLEDSH